MTYNNTVDEIPGMGAFEETEILDAIENDITTSTTDKKVDRENTGVEVGNTGLHVENTGVVIKTPGEQYK